MKILITGCAGFIGFHLTKYLLNYGHDITGIDNMNDYYDTNLKYARLIELGIYKENIINERCILNSKYDNLNFFKVDLQDREFLNELFSKSKFDIVIHLAAQAGVRYSIVNPQAYIDSNIQGFFNVLECCRSFNVGHLIYASSSSVYGLNKTMPFSTDQKADQPASLYAATKKSNELMAHAYSHLFNIKTTGLRFFTVYGPWGRPDMAMYLFTKAIIEGEPIQVFNNGNMKRDFTYIDDIVMGIAKIINKTDIECGSPDCTAKKHNIFNIGRGKPVALTQFISEIENLTGITAKKQYLPMQLGDVEETWSDVSDLEREYNYQPSVSVSEGVKRFIKWYKYYNHVERMSLIKKSI